MRDDQIEDVVNKFRDAVLQCRAEITDGVAKNVLNIDNLGMMMFASFRRCAEAVSDLIIRKVSVNRKRTQREALDATQFKQYIDCRVVDEMPKGEGNEVEVIFFKLNLSERNGLIFDNDLEKEYEFRGLKPADPLSIAALNEEDPTFAYEHPHGTHWKNAEGEWRYAVFQYWGDTRKVDVYSRSYGWGGEWWFAGLRK